MRAFIPSIALLLLASSLMLDGRELPPIADGWLTNAPAAPARFHASAGGTNYFAHLRAEVVAGRFRVSCPVTNFGAVVLVESAEAPGHWPARNWQSHAMKSNAANWFLELPIENLHVPLIYFAVAKAPGVTLASPMRLAMPGALGLEEPTRFFWPFMEGFEDGLDAWQGFDSVPLRTDSHARNGRSALLVRVPTGRAVTVSTTRLRGWALEEHGARAVALWMRTKGGKGTATFSLVGNAFTPKQVVSRRIESTPVTPQWTKVRLPFESFPGLTLADTDLFSIELAGPPGIEFLIDDLHLLGRWSSDF